MLLENKDSKVLLEIKVFREVQVLMVNKDSKDQLGRTDSKVFKVRLVQLEPKDSKEQLESKVSKEVQVLMESKVSKVQLEQPESKVSKVQLE